EPAQLGSGEVIAHVREPYPRGNADGARGRREEGGLGDAEARSPGEARTGPEGLPGAEVAVWRVDDLVAHGVVETYGARSVVARLPAHPRREGRDLRRAAVDVLAGLQARVHELSGHEGDNSRLPLTLPSPPRGARETLRAPLPPGNEGIITSPSP